ncbi:MAG: hypothetical protein A2X36_04430 [Elusimicrobia bacterium GWA2_69_24]|nr:MAG: hypothetical protein A2X36_04430 [Elusimicrobia bacterium GWA2_69_24]HBL19063.1 hypothetical protein [Elusimicrobiota bacterium]
MNTKGFVTASAACLCALAAAAAVLPSPALARDAVAGVVIDVKGKPQVRRSGKTADEALKVNKFVYEGDVIKTGAGELAAIAFVGGAEIRINEGSEFIIESGGGRQSTSVFTKVGQAWTRLLHGRAGMSVRTPLAVAAVRGTEADVDVHDRMTVKVYEGLVDVSNDFGKQSLQAGMMTQVGAAGQAPAPAAKMSGGDYASWQNGLQPKDVEKKLDTLFKKAEKEKLLKLKFKDKDGKSKEVDMKLEKE